MATFYNCKCGKRHKVGDECPNKYKYKYSNLTEEQRKQNIFYNSSKWIKKRETVKKLDKGMCQRCLIKHELITTSQLEVHHIKKLMLFWELRFDETNLVTLCRTCHTQIDKQNDGELDFKWCRNIDDLDYEMR